MYKCSICTFTLNPQGKTRPYFKCPQGHGFAVPRNSLESISSLEQHVTTNALNRPVKRIGNKPCAKCTQPMEVFFNFASQGLEIDWCRICRLFWFDFGELEAAMTPAQEINNVNLAREILKEMTPEKGHLEGFDSANLTMVETLLIFVGKPVEQDNYGLRVNPIATYSIIAICTLIQILTFGKSDAIHTEWGFYALHPFRHLGLNSLTSFFLHGGWIHLISNMYFLFLCGDNAEDELGTSQFLILLFGSTFFGNLANTFIAIRDVPAIGASGAVFGVLVYYAVRFPKNRFISGFFFFLRIFAYSVSARLFIAFYVLLQFIGARAQIRGMGNIDYVAHLGGGLFGLVFALAQKPRGKNI